LAYDDGQTTADAVNPSAMLTFGHSAANEAVIFKHVSFYRAF